MISVVVPTFKRPKNLKRLLESIFSQSEKPNEVIIIDDCSNMKEEYNQVISNLPNSEINVFIYFNEKNMGAPYSRNYGILKAQGDWIALVDDDDIWLKDKIKYQKNIIENSFINYDFITCSSYIEKTNESKKISRIPEFFLTNPKKYILQSNYIMSPTVLIKKLALVNTGLFDEELPSCQDWDMWVRIILNGYKIAIINKPLTIYKKDNIDSIGLSKNAKKGYRLFLRKHFFNILKYTSIKNWIKMFIVYFLNFI